MYYVTCSSEEIEKVMVSALPKMSLSKRFRESRKESLRHAEVRMQMRSHLHTKTQKQAAPRAGAFGGSNIRSRGLYSSANR